MANRSEGLLLCAEAVNKSGVVATNAIQPRAKFPQQANRKLKFRSVDFDPLDSQSRPKLISEQPYWEPFCVFLDPLDVCAEHIHVVNEVVSGQVQLFNLLQRDRTTIPVDYPSSQEKVTDTGQTNYHPSFLHLLA